MITERETVKSEVIFNDDRTHKFVLKRTWNKAKPQAMVVMLNPCDADSVICDTTTFLVVNNVARLEDFGGVTIVNLYSLMSSKLCLKWYSDEELTLPENDDYIVKNADEASKIIIAWGRGVEMNKRIEDRAMQVLNLLMPYREKMFLISDGDRVGLHPLTPSIRNRWILEHFDEASVKAKKKRQEAIPVEINTEKIEANEDKEATVVQS